jgi:hypothetical protein
MPGYGEPAKSGKYRAAFDDGSELELHAFDMGDLLVALADKMYLRMDLMTTFSVRQWSPLDESDDVAAKFWSYEDLDRSDIFVEATLWYPRHAIAQVAVCEEAGRSPVLPSERRAARLRPS